MSSMFSTRRTDHDLDHLDPNLPFCDAVHDLHITNPTRKHALDNADYTAPTRQHKLDHADQEKDLPF